MAAGTAESKLDDATPTINLMSKLVREWKCWIPHLTAGNFKVGPTFTRKPGNGLATAARNCHVT
jgi:hypothetical protein